MVVLRDEIEHDNLFDAEEQELLFLSNYSRPVTLIDLREGEIDDHFQFLFSNSSDNNLRIHCNNLLLVNAIIKSRTCLELDRIMNTLSQVYTRLKDVYRLMKTVIVTSECSKEDKAYNLLLSNISQEQVFLLLPEKSELRHWRIADNQVHRYEYNSSNDWPQLNHTKIKKFANRHLKVATINHPPAVIIKNETNLNEAEAVDGIEHQLLKMVAELLNFTFDYNRSRPLEKWAGMVKLVAEKGVDIAIGDNYLYAKTSCSIPHKFNYEGFIVPTPQPYPKWTALVYPFSVTVWLATLLSIILVVLILKCLAKWTDSTQDKSFLDLTLCLSYVIGSLLGVCQPRQISTMTFRLFVIFWLLSAATIISTVYRSGFISLMISPPSKRPIDTIRELSESSLNKASVSYAWFFKKSDNVYEQKIGKEIVQANTSDIMHLLGSGSWAIESDLDHLQYALLTQYSATWSSSRFHVMKERFYPTRSCMLLQNDSPLKVHIDRAIQQLRESGFVNYYRSKFVKKLNELKPHQVMQSTVIPFSLDHLQGAFYILIFGVLLSLVAFVLEYLVFHLTQQQTECK